METIATAPSMLRSVKGIAHQYGWRLVMGEIPRLYFGNDAGLAENLAGRRELRRVQKLSALGAHAIDERAAFLRREGYLLLGRPYESELVSRIQQRVRALVTDPAASRAIGPRLKEAIRGVVDPLQQIPEIAQLLSGDIRRVVRDYYGAHFKVEHVRVWRNVHVEGEWAQRDVYSNLWHNDHDPITLLRLFVYMSDGVTRDTGATRFHPIPATKAIIRRGYLRRRAILAPARRLLEDESRIRFFEGDAGSACLLNPQLCLHSASVPRSGAQRDIIQFTIAPADRPIDDDWFRTIAPDPAMA